MFSPGQARILQCVSDVLFAPCRKVLDVRIHCISREITYIPSEFILHEQQTTDRKLRMVNASFDVESGVKAPLRIGEVVRERFVKHADGIML
jgi:hypothetical protein